MEIREHELDVDFAEELEPYVDSFSRVKVRGHKLQACSPFREESTPSFAVNLENGTWIDSGAQDENWMKGNFIKLLAFLQEVTYGEAEEYLIHKYRTIMDDVDNLSLDIQLESTESYRELTLEDLRPFAFRSPYLGKRGITEKIQKAFKIGYDKKSEAVVFVWMDKNGKPVNFKFRKVKSKIFWYLSDGQPIKQHVYGLHFIHKMNLKTVYVVESETDALYLWSVGVPAVALGSASLSKKQEELILNSPIETLVMAFDKDHAGNRCREDVIKRLLGKVDLKVMHMPKGCKDVNDISRGKISEATGRLEDIVPTFL